MRIASAGRPKNATVIGNAYISNVGCPSIYLKSNVKFIDGDGSKDNPYKLSI